MKRIYLYLLALVMVLVIKPCFAVSYGGLYGVEWCPCDPEERFDEQGSVVLGKTVMCPCSSMYKGYGNASNNNYSPKSTPPGSRKKNNLNHLNYTYYIGVDYNKANIKTKHEKLIFGDSNKSIEANELIDDLDDNISAVLGMRPHPNMGIEAFYNRVAKKNEVEKGNTTYSAKYHAFGVDLIGYLPVTNYLDFVAVAGIGQYYFESSASYPDAAAEDAFGRTLAFRAGAGLQINLRSGIIIRSMYRYVHIDNMNIQKLQEFSLGVRIAF